MWDEKAGLPTLGRRRQGRAKFQQKFTPDRVPNSKIYILKSVRKLAYI